MAKDKEKQINPAAAARKAEKAKAVKKGKAAINQQRNERLAKQNPHRIQSQIDDLKALEANHSINPREKKQLDDLERELARVIKAKEAAGEKYIPRKSQDGDTGVLGKRGRGEEQARRRAARYEPQSSDTDADVGEIPMPRDTPPPVPRRRKEDGEQQRVEHELPEKVEAGPTQAVYESKPVLRDFVKEAATFVPAAVRKRKLEGGGDVKVVKAEVKDEPVTKSEGPVAATSSTTDLPDVDDELKRLQQEEEQWRKETRQVTMEEVEDEDA